MRRRSYVIYSIGCAISWAIVLGAFAATTSSHYLGYVLCTFWGWVLCWISATIARYVYTPPAKWFRSPPCD